MNSLPLILACVVPAVLLAYYVGLRVGALEANTWRTAATRAEERARASEDRQRDLEMTLVAKEGRMDSLDYMRQRVSDLENREIFPDETDWWEDGVMD